MLPVRKGISSLLVLSTPKAKAMVESFLMEFSRSYKMFTKSQISTKLAPRSLESRAQQSTKHFDKDFIKRPNHLEMNRDCLCT